MKSTMTLHPLIALMTSLAAPLVTSAATIWDGPPISVSNATQPDQITTNVWIVRGSTQGIYNSAEESGFTHYFSPAGTEWADGTTANYASLSYTNWNYWAKDIHGGPPNTIGVPAVMHLITNDIYLNITFTSWDASGNYSYQRSTPPAGTNIPPSVAITAPTNGASFSAPAIVPIVATASDPDDSVTNVAFFDGSTFLGQTNNTPYTFTATLASGSHALTAVATDSGGLSSTSAVVNVTVGVPNIPPSVTITNPPDPTTNGNTDIVTIQIAASDSDGTVTNVQLFNGARLLHSFSSAPYNFSGTAIAGSFALGTNTLTAVATDNLGASSTSAPVHVIIARYLPPISNGTVHVFLQLVATNLGAPLYGISPPGDTNRLFVLDQGGRVWVIQNGVLLPTPALNITNRVQPPLVASNPNDERGLLGLAFHPGYNNPASPGYRTLYTYNSEMIPNGTLPDYVCPNGATNNYRNVFNEWKISSHECQCD